MSQRLFPRLAPVLLLAALLLLLGRWYAQTLPPGLSSFQFNGWSDLAEFQVVGAYWGLEHSPGYPLYTLAANLWVRLVGLIAAHTEPAWRVSAFSLATALPTLALLWAILRRFGVHAALAGATVFWVGTTPLFWRHAIVAEVYMLNLLLLLLALWLALRWEAGAGQERWTLLALGVTFGAIAAHHRSALFAGPILVGWMVAVRRDGWRPWAQRLGWLALGGVPMLLLYAYLPGAVLADRGRGMARIYADASDPGTLWSMILSREWWGVVQPPRTLAGWGEALRELGRLQAGQLGGAWAVALGGVGLAVGGKRALPMVGLVGAFLYFGAAYRTYDVDTMLLPLTALLGLGAALAVQRATDALVQRLPEAQRRGATLALVAVALMGLVWAVPRAGATRTAVDQSGDTLATDLIETLHILAEDGGALAVIAHQHDRLATVQYARLRYGLPDLVPIYPNKLQRDGDEGVRAFLALWSNRPRRVFYTADARVAEIEVGIAEGRYRLVPTYFPDLKQLLPTDRLAPTPGTPEYPQPIALPNGLTLLGTDQRWVTRRTGQYLRLMLHWQVDAPVTGAYRIRLQPQGLPEGTLESAAFDGLLLGGLPTNQLPAGATLRDGYLLRLNLPLPVNAQPVVEVHLEPLAPGLPHAPPILIPIESPLGG